jgi:hypothetical protein
MSDLDPRVRAVLGGTDPYGQPVIEMPDELRDVLAAAVTGLGAELPVQAGGVGVVLGSGVIGRLVQPPTENDANPVLTLPSRLDKRA